MKRTICILSVLAVLLLAVLAMGKSGVLSRKEETQEGERTLWVITEETVQDGMNSIARRMADQFMEQHGNVTVKLDVLPNSQEERTAYLAQIEKQAEEGNGPDVYLLPTNDVLTVEHPEVYTYCRITPLFPDVEQAMHQGKFQDIGPYYEVDSQLEKDALAEKVMDSGIVNGRRYVIPLRYNLPVLYCSEELLQEQNVDTAIFQAGFDRWMENAVEKGGQNPCLWRRIPVPVCVRSDPGLQSEEGAAFYRGSGELLFPFPECGIPGWLAVCPQKCAIPGKQHTGWCDALSRRSGKAESGHGLCCHFHHGRKAVFHGSHPGN